MARYSSTAVDKLYTQINAGIAALLTTIETENSLTAGVLPAPSVILKREAPFEQRFPRVEIFEMELTPDGGSGGQRNGIYEVSCRVLLFYKSDADLDTAAVRFRLYVEAMVRVVLATPDLGGVTSGEGTIHAILRRVQFSADSENESTTVHGAAIDWLVGVQSTIGG